MSDLYPCKFLLPVLHPQLSILLLASAPLSPLPQELYQRCERMRPMLFRLASDTEDNDEALGKLICPFSLCPLLPPSFRERGTASVSSRRSVWGGCSL